MAASLREKQQGLVFDGQAITAGRWMPPPYQASVLPTTEQTSVPVQLWVGTLRDTMTKLSTTCYQFSYLGRATTTHLIVRLTPYLQKIQSSCGEFQQGDVLVNGPGGTTLYCRRAQESHYTTRPHPPNHLTIAGFSDSTWPD